MNTVQAQLKAKKQAEIIVLFNNGKSYHDIVHNYNYTKYMVKNIQDALFPNTEPPKAEIFENSKSIFSWDLIKNDIFGIGQFN